MFKHYYKLKYNKIKNVRPSAQIENIRYLHAIENLQVALGENEQNITKSVAPQRQIRVRRIAKHVL